MAYLALGDLDAYRYNNQAYTSLYKQISVDVSLEDYCTRMQLSANNKIVAIMLCVALVVLLLVGYYALYLRHRLMYRYGLEQVLEINRRALAQPSSCQDDVQHSEYEDTVGRRANSDIRYGRIEGALFKGGFSSHIYYYDSERGCPGGIVRRLSDKYVNVEFAR